VNIAKVFWGGRNAIACISPALTSDLDISLIYNLNLLESPVSKKKERGKVSPALSWLSPAGQ
jgi:hypothetical protein